MPYRKIYRLRLSVPGKNSVEVTFPYDVVERKAREKHLSVPEFLSRFHAIAQYNGTDGVLYTLEERK